MCPFLLFTKTFTLLPIFEAFIFGFQTYFPVVSPQGLFPKLENVAAFRPIYTEPQNATCGFPHRSVFCQSNGGVESLRSCTQRFCVQDCPYRSTTPTFNGLLLGNLGTCVKKDVYDLRPRSSHGSSSFIFYDHKDCFVNTRADVGSSFTLAVWLKPEQAGEMCVIEKSADGQIVFKLTISERETVFYYRTVNGLQPPIKVMTQGRCLPQRWIHLSVQVHYTRISFFIDGPEEDLQAFDSRILTDPINNNAVDNFIQIGQNIHGMEQFIGKMQDFRLYPEALTNREISQVFSGKFQQTSFQSECRCPGSHPRLESIIGRYCLPNGVGNSTKDKVLRINPNTHPVSYMNDNDLDTMWISSLLSTSDIDKGITITVDLDSGQYQIFYITLHFYGLMPKELRIQRRKHSSSAWEDWQYIARDCQDIGLENNGFLQYPDSVNCLQFSKQMSYSDGNMTLSLLTPEPNHRPGYSDFYSTYDLQEFVKASLVRFHLTGQYYTTENNTSMISFRHRYYGLREITITGRCNCHGHADACDTGVSPYKCLCDVNSYTEGSNCERCLPLFNDKPFHQGDHVNAFSCRPCQCYNHSSSCHYDATVDPYPHDHGRGGGGVCHNCLHNTTGRNCEVCKDSFFRQLDADPAAIDVCRTCDCNEDGTVNKSQNCEKVGGQCHCRTNVWGRQCDQCKEGFYNLQRSNPDGCQPCYCNSTGTLNESNSCHQTTGQCRCKANIVGRRCDRCKLGYRQDTLGRTSCIQCTCNAYGSINQFCNPTSGQCKCREHVSGRDCDTCIDNYYGLAADACKPCECRTEGIIPGTVCDAMTGQCVCKPNVSGRQCNECLDGYYKSTENDSVPCLPCQCDKSGTINGRMTCHRVTGQCLCKASVVGQCCHVCMDHTYNLTAENPVGCQDCDCDPDGTLPGSVCDPTHGQCQCLPNYEGRRCSQCKPGLYFSGDINLGCVSCACHPRGSFNATCSHTSGQCHCQDVSVSGAKCDQCRDSFYQFNEDTGRCQPCLCSTAGAVNSSCHAVSGQCFCKSFVRGMACEDCMKGASHLDENNPYGCSATPSQQPPPRGQVLNSTAIILTWNPPDSPNSNCISYVLYRDGLEIDLTDDCLPYSSQIYIDGNLSPYTTYTYHLDVRNVHGAVSSAKVAFRTNAGPPSGEIEIGLITPVDPYSISLNWTANLQTSGPVEIFRVMYTSNTFPETMTAYQGLDTKLIVHNLQPFTKYNFFIQACNPEGCLQSLPLTVITAQAPPVGQPPPVVQNSSATELYLQWSPPTQPNGVILRYELYMRGVHQTVERRIFHASGWLNPQPLAKSENVLMPPVTSANVTNLEPNMEYEFCVVTTNMAGSTSSGWVTFKTQELEPIFMGPPIVSPVSPYFLHVSWEKPGNDVTRGDVTGYILNLLLHSDAEMSDTGRATSEVIYVAESEELSYGVSGLEPYCEYSFTVTLCNRIGCVTSDPGFGKTLAAAPGKLHPPLVVGVNSTSMKIAWSEPLKLNGPSPFYQLERIEPSLTIETDVNFIKGTRFPGHGYYRFPASTLPMNTYFTGIKIQFRTKEADGLILCAVSAGSQEEYIVLQIRRGRPYFLFDPQDSAVAVTPTNDGYKHYNDNKWHQITVTRNQNMGNITVDGNYTGSSSSSSARTVIGENTGVFIGGLPNTFTVERSDKGDTEIVRKNFVGCLGDIFIQRSDNYDEEWDQLDWDTAEERMGVYEKWEGCPETAEDGAHFLGFGFLELYHTIFPGGADFKISFMFRTDQLKGLLLFIYNQNGSDYIMAELDNGIVTLQCKSNSSLRQVNLWVGLSYCNGQWNMVHFKKEGSMFSVQLNALIESVTEADAFPIITNSSVYIGGVPEIVQNLFPNLYLQRGFGGCIKELRFIEGAGVVNIASMSSYTVRVDLDGCPSTARSVNCRGNDSIVVYRGDEKTAYDHNLQPFTEYMYRVIASNQGGSAASPWNRGRSKPGFPLKGQTLINVVAVDGRKIEVSWERATSIRGVTEGYILKAVSEHSPNISASTVYLKSHQRSGTLMGLMPFTKYAVTLSTCTLAGCGESSPVVNVTTLEEAPGDVQAPTVISSSPGSLHVGWLPPKLPNGLITKYNFYMNGSQVYSGNSTHYNITGLGTFTGHRFVVSACTLVGCTNSSEVTLMTAQLPPEHVPPPLLTVLNSTSIYVEWQEPKIINGILERYLLHIRDDVSSVWNTVYNSTELFLDYTIQGLVPGTRYFVKMTACSGGGCTTSGVMEAFTEESIPGGLQIPMIQSFSPDSFNITWSKPTFPNGVIRSYGLFMDGILMQRCARLSCFVDGLTPWSKHSFRLQACTAKGCALGEKLEVYTQEARPEGTIQLYSTISSPRSVMLKWEGPENPNGHMTYKIIFSGLFYEKDGDDIRNVSRAEKILHQDEGDNKWIYVDDLVPFSSYVVFVNASNSKGHVTSDPIQITMPPAAPDGVLPPRLSSASPTSLQVVWPTPVRNNAPGLPHYRLQMRPTNPTDETTDLFSGPSASLTYTINDLQPYTMYDLRIAASNMYGDTYSRWVTVSTEQDMPGPIDPPLLLNLESRSITIMWPKPVKPNGVITHFNLYQNGDLIAVIPGNSSRYTSNNLVPFTRYQYQIEACTSAGCSLSQASLDVKTLADAPDEIAAPDLHSDTPTSVTIRWKLPLIPNGLIENMRIEKRLKGTEHVYTLATLPGHHPMQYLDQADDINPWKTYEYRILMTTFNGGTNSSEWAEVTTRPARPVGVQPPEVTLMGPYTVQVAWKVPLIPNGEILNYEIRMPEPKVVINDTSVFSYTMTNLIPYTNYSVSVVACSGSRIYLGGCTESLPTLITTQPAPPEGVVPPSAIPISETFIAVYWKPPTWPNGPNLRFELLRRTILQPLASNPPKDLNLWQNIYSGTRWFYEDKGLSRYTSYEYRLAVHNAVGHTFSAEVVGTTLPGPPIRGSHLTLQPVNHTAIEASWTKPTIQDLQGEVDHYTLVLRSARHNQTLTFPAHANGTVIGGLYPNTEHQLYLEVSNGPHSVSSSWVHVTTLDGEPEGMLPPEVTAINKTSVRVIWTPPLNPNGVVTEYSIYVNDKAHRTDSRTPYLFILGNLVPYTVYNIQVEVCTVYACVRSNATQAVTAEVAPRNILPPAISNITSRSVQIRWASPEQPNGIILGYELRRKAWYPCTLQTQVRSGNGTTGTPGKYPKGEELCGEACYDPSQQVCCSGVLHDRKDEHQCCDGDYISHATNSTWTCCSGQTHEVQPNHQCCGRYYIQLPAGEVCCYNGSQNQVSIGEGDSCCGGVPYLVTGYQICCRGDLYDGYSHQCCGGHILPQSSICCGDEASGSIYRQLQGLSCCGADYVNMTETTCCSGSNGQFKAHLRINDGKVVKCCETKLIPEEEECCSRIGHNPLTHICSDKPLTQSFAKENGSSDTPCPLALSSGTTCGRRSFNSSTDCFRLQGETISDKVDGEALCPTDEETVYSGGAHTHSFIDTGLHPFSTYEYRILSWNSVGQDFSNATQVTTSEDIPQGISPPKWTLADSQEAVISLEWEEPSRLSGIVQYVLLRDGTERYLGTRRSFQDRRSIHPYKEYTYQLRVCTTAGCLDSAKVIAAVKLGFPENISPPVVTTVNSSALHLSWAEPRKPNGDIREYQIHQVDKGLIHVTTSGNKQYTITGLEPYTRYLFFLVACTSAGCNRSEVSAGQTSQASPEGVWLNPYHVTINSSALELYWRKPERPNGRVTEYRLIRDGTVISTRSEQDLNFTDSGLKPNSRYVYQLEARTEGGSTSSQAYVVETPQQTPEDIPAPYNITMLGPSSIFLTWGLPGVYNPSLPLEYNVLSFSHASGQLHPAGEKQFVIVEDLIPGTPYTIKLQACQNGSCGVSHAVNLTTMEAEPEDLDSPQLTAAGPKAVRITWSEPRKPNGIITSYNIHRRLAGQQDNMTLFVWSGGALEYTDISDELLPYTSYEYCVTAQNSVGTVKSPWTLVCTLEASPENMLPPSAKATSAYSVSLNWTAPLSPHGNIIKYFIIYGLAATDPTSSSSANSKLTVPGTTNEAKVFGLLPSTTYRISVEASNSAGRVASSWISIRTLEAAPSGLRNFSVETRENGRALLLQWSPPERTNGLLKTYNIYSDGNLEFSGLTRQFLFRRLEPYTVYSLVLEACTSVGCTRTIPQLIQTGEAPPSSQLPPHIDSFNASHITLMWSPPSQPNGKMVRYEVIKRFTKDSSPRKKLNENVVFRETNAKQAVFSYTDVGLHPWTHYEYKIRGWNSVGYTDSSWTSAQTSQAAPGHLRPPKLFQKDGGLRAVTLQWSKPDEDNGKILHYRLQRNNLTFSFSFDSETFEYIDKDVAPDTEYSYSIMACTLGGCTTSNPSSIKTFEGPPKLVNPPIVEARNSNEANVSWLPPQIPNGEITKYIVKMDNETYHAGRRLSIIVSNLLPFTLYNTSLIACTSGGCTSSSSTFFRTLEAKPSQISPPVSKLTSTQSISISWQSPEKPNGVIKSYELHRNGQAIYTGLDTHYHDFGLQPGTEYTYIVQASNSKGSSWSSPSTVWTPPSSPSGMEPPQLQAQHAHEILVTWKAPLKTNGKILNYTLYVRHPAEMMETQYLFNSSFAFQSIHSFVVKNLNPYSQYEAKVEACTQLGCAVSGWATGRTQEAPPDSQPAPLIDVRTNEHAPLLTWNKPQHPNGKILAYEVYRRTLKDLQETTPAELVYNGSALSFQDGSLLPFTEYEYKVMAVNSAGRAASQWTRCRTGPGAPVGLQAPVFHTVSATFAVANITPPARPNGIVSLYRLFSRTGRGTDTVLSEGTSTNQVIYGLKPFTNYSIGIEACTCPACCSSGPVSHLTTQPAPPAHQRPPQVTHRASRAVSLEWSQPQSPNGIIQRYEVHLQNICPPSSIVVERLCTQGSVEVVYSGTEEVCNITGLQPFTTYSLRVTSHNSEGSASSKWINSTTLKEKPEYKSVFYVSSNITTLFVDWELSFQLNGQLKEFVLTEKGQRLYSGLDIAVHLPKTADKTFYFQVRCTTDMGSVSTPIVKYNSATGLDAAHSFPNTKNGTEARGKTIYTEPWFIILMTLLALLLLAILLSVLLQRKLSKQPYPRERPPLVPVQQRMSPSNYSQSETYTSDLVAELSGSSNRIMLKSYIMHLEGASDIKISGMEAHTSHNTMVVRKTSHGQISHSFSQNSLYRSASQLISSVDKKSILDGSIWDSTIQGHDSGMYMDDEDLVSTIKSFSTMTKQHTAFTDTPL
ncbi:usherin [Gastrophryne carolinensis]